MLEARGGDGSGDVGVSLDRDACCVACCGVCGCRACAPSRAHPSCARACRAAQGKSCGSSRSRSAPPTPNRKHAGEIATGKHKSARREVELQVRRQHDSTTSQQNSEGQSIKIDAIDVDVDAVCRCGRVVAVAVAVECLSLKLKDIVGLTGRGQAGRGGVGEPPQQRTPRPLRRPCPPNESPSLGVRISSTFPLPTTTTSRAVSLPFSFKSASLSPGERCAK